MNKLGRNKLGGDHTTIIGGRKGKKLVQRIAEEYEVKKIIPGIIKVGMPPKGGLRAKFLRPDERGNLRLLIREGSSVQEIFIVTKASSFEEGRKIAEKLEKYLR